MALAAADLRACHVSDGHLSFQQRKERWERNAARNRWFLDLLRAISVCPKTGLNVALPLRLTRSAAHSYGNVEVPASTFLRKSGSAKRSRRQCYICTTERFSFQFAWKLLLCFAFPAREKDALKPWFQRAFLGTFVARDKSSPPEAGQTAKIAGSIVSASGIEKLSIEQQQKNTADSRSHPPWERVFTSGWASSMPHGRCAAGGVPYCSAVL